MLDTGKRPECVDTADMSNIIKGWARTNDLQERIHVPMQIYNINCNHHAKIKLYFGEQILQSLGEAEVERDLGLENPLLSLKYINSRDLLVHENRKFCECIIPLRRFRLKGYLPYLLRV